MESMTSTRLRWWWWLLWSWWSSWYRNKTVAILGIWLTKGEAAFYQKGVGGGGSWGSNPRCLPDCHVGIHSKSDTHFFACAVCEAGGICPHPILHWRVRLQEGPSILPTKILSQTVIDDENTLMRKGTFNDGFFEKISTAFVQKEWIFEINLGFG